MAGEIIHIIPVRLYTAEFAASRRLVSEAPVPATDKITNVQPGFLDGPIYPYFEQTQLAHDPIDLSAPPISMFSVAVPDGKTAEQTIARYPETGWIAIVEPHGEIEEKTDPGGVVTYAERVTIKAIVCCRRRPGAHPIEPGELLTEGVLVRGEESYDGTLISVTHKEAEQIPTSRHYCNFHINGGRLYFS